MSRTHRHNLAYATEPAEDTTRSTVDPVQARLAFDVCVDQLCAVGVATITREDTSTERAVIPCLLDQLTEAVQPGGERTGGAATGSRPPVSMNALAIAAEIGTEMREQLAAHSHHVSGPGPRHSLTQQVRLWASHAETWQHTDPDYLGYAADRASRWVTAVRAVVEPTPTYRLRGLTCPVCRETTVLIWSQVEAEYVRRPALSIDTDRVEAVCHACDTTWGLDAWERLGHLVDAQRHASAGLDCE